MSTFITNISTNFTTTDARDFLSRLQRTLNISRKTLIIIGVVVIISIIILIIVLIYCIKKCLKGDNERKKKHKTNVEKDIFGDDAAKYDSKYGYLDLSVTYDRQKKRLTIRDIQANNLVSTSSEPPDCFLKVFLKNEKGKKINIKKTKPKIDNFTPYFNESFTYTFESSKDAVVHFQVIDNNPNGNNILLGEGVLDMKTIETTRFIGIICQTYVILEKPLEKEGFGDVCVVITLRLNKLRIVILEAKVLIYKYAKIKYVGVFQYPSVHAEVNVYLKKIRKKHFITKKLQNTENPYFLESFDVSVKEVDLKNMYIKVQLYESTTIKIRRKIGQVFIGNPEMNEKINAFGKFHWDTVCYDRNLSKAMWHSLFN